VVGNNNYVLCCIFVSLSGDKVLLMTKKVKNLILGAGITGLSTGYHLKHDYLILEKNEIGGLARSKRIKEYTFDFSAHHNKGAN